VAAPLKLIPSTATTHPTSGQAGDLYVSTDPTASAIKHLWFCTKASVGTTAATWVQVA